MSIIPCTVTLVEETDTGRRILSESVPGEIDTSVPSQIQGRMSRPAVVLIASTRVLVVFTDLDGKELIVLDMGMSLRVNDGFDLGR